MRCVAVGKDAFERWLSILFWVVCDVVGRLSSRVGSSIILSGLLKVLFRLG